MNGSTRTHENEDPIGIFLPALNHLVVFVICGFTVYGEERPRAVAEVRFSLQWLIRLRVRVEVVICYM
jgi:hypothetical protein